MPPWLLRVADVNYLAARELPPQRLTVPISMVGYPSMVVVVNL